MSLGNLAKVFRAEDEEPSDEEGSASGECDKTDAECVALSTDDYSCWLDEGLCDCICVDVVEIDAVPEPGGRPPSLIDGILAKFPKSPDLPDVPVGPPVFDPGFVDPPKTVGPWEVTDCVDSIFYEKFFDSGAIYQKITVREADGSYRVVTTRYVDGCLEMKCGRGWKIVWCCSEGETFDGVFSRKDFKPILDDAGKLILVNDGRFTC